MAIDPVTGMEMGYYPSMSQFDFMLAPSEQYTRYLGQRFPQATSFQQAAARGAMSPAYSLYSAVEPYGQFGSFGEFLTESPDVTRQQILNAAMQAGGYGGYRNPTLDAGRELETNRFSGFTPEDNPAQYALFYGGSGVTREQALQRQQRLAATQALSELGPRAAFNPALQRAAAGAVQDMYNRYLGGTASGVGSFAQAGPTGFMNYYLQQRRLAGV